MKALNKLLPLCVLLAIGCAAESMNSEEKTMKKPAEVQPPVAKQVPKEIRAHDDVRQDEYYWLRDDKRKNPEMLAYLKAENAYLQSQLGHTDDLQEAIYQELVGRIDPNESSVPVFDSGHYYYERYEPGKEQAIHARREGSLEASEQVLLDENVLGADHEYYNISNYEISDDDQWLVWTEDTVSRNEFDIRFKNLKTGKALDRKISKTGSSLAFASDNKTLFYVKKDPATLRSYQVWRHEIGSPADSDMLVFEETDETFSIGVGRSRDDRQILLYSGATLSTEMRLLSVDDPMGEFKPFLPREADHEYSIETVGDTVYVATNWNAPNFRIMRAPLGSGENKDKWQEVVPHREDVLIEDFLLFDEYLILEETQAGVKQLQIIPLDGSDPQYIKTDEPAYVAVIGDNPSTNSTTLRYEYSSLTTPDSVYDLDLKNGERKLLKQAFAGDNFDASRYRVERMSAKARDGVEVPVTLMRQKDAQPDGSHPIYVLGYGAYGSWYEPEFRRDILSLVDRGFIFAIAHIRGGQEMGRTWYDDGKLFNKLNTFNDFIDVGRFVVESGWAHPEKVVGMGRSAGGLLIGAVANMAPDVFDVLVTEVPFVDVMTTMEDDTIPLTTFEYDEWGNPADKAYYDYMRAYSPYDQVEAKDYPHILVSTGLWDSQVQYWEPAKWVARLRRLKTDTNRLLFYIDMNAGHGGGSGRFERQKDTAREFAFILDTLNVTNNAM